MDPKRGNRYMLVLVGVLSLAMVTMAFMACEDGAWVSSREWSSPPHTHVHSSQSPIGADIVLLNYTAPSFTWLGPVSFQFTILSNVTLNNSLYLAISSTDTLQSIVELLSLSPGLNIFELDASVLPTATPGDKLVNVTFAHAGNSVSISHEMWVGSGFIPAMAFLAGSVIVAVAIIVKYNAQSPGAVTSGGGTSFTAGSADDDMSTVTYVDQSRAPPGSIFCPECKKTIEEGSIFCPECGTRIPRYLRYKP